MAIYFNTKKSDKKQVKPIIKTSSKKLPETKNPLINAKDITNIALPSKTTIKTTQNKPTVKINTQGMAKADKAIKSYKQDYKKAAAKNDYAGMRVANNNANAVRNVIGAKPYSSAVGDKQKKNNLQIADLKNKYNDAYEVGNYKAMRSANNKANKLREGIGVKPISSAKTDKKRAKQVKELWDKMPAYTNNDISIIETSSRVPSLAGGVYRGANLTEKVRDNTTKALNQNAATFGAMEGFSPVSAKRQLEKQVGAINTATVEDGLPYKAGYMGGMMGQYALTGGLAHGSAKAGITKVLPALAGSKLGRGTASVVADALTGVPVNAIDSAKMSFDENDKFNIKDFGKNMAINTALDVGFGAGLEGIGAALKKGGTMPSAPKAEKIPVVGKDGKIRYERQVASEKPIRKESAIEALTRNNDANRTSYIKSEAVPDEYRANYEDYLDAADPRLISFAERAKDRKLSPKAVHVISTVGQREVEDIKNLTGIDVQGYSHGVKPNAFEHIEKRHGIKGQQDSSMANIGDVGRIPYVLKEYDKVEIAVGADGTPDLSYEFRNADGTPSVKLKYQKRINGHYYIIEAVPDSKAASLKIISAYIEKGNKEKRSSQMLNVPKDPQLTSETPVALTSFNDSISKSINNVKELTKDASYSKQNALPRYGEKLTAAKDDSYSKQFISHDAPKAEKIPVVGSDGKIRYETQAVSEKPIRKESAIEALTRSNNANRTSYIKSESIPDEYRGSYEDYLGAADKSIKKFVERSRSGEINRKAFKDLSVVNEREVSDIGRILGLDITGYKRRLKSSTVVDHIDRRHGTRGKADKSMSDINDFARINYVMEEADIIEPLFRNDGSRSISKEILNYDGSNALEIRYKKRINGHYYVVAAVPDNKSKALQIVSAYIEKVGKKPTNSADHLVPMVKDPIPLTSETSDGIMQSTTAINNSIPNSKNNVKMAMPDNNLYGKPKGKTSAIYTSLVDNQAAIGKATKGVEQSADKDVKILTSNARNASSTAKYAIENGFVSMSGKKLSDATPKKIFESAAKLNEDDFADYLLHKHNIDRYPQKKPVFGNDVTAEMSEVKVAEYEKMYPEFIKLSDEWNKLNVKLVDEWLVKGGLITKDFGETLKSMYPNYAPTIRSGSILADGYNSKTLKAKNVVKSAVGGNRDILPPSVSIPAQMQRVIKAVRTNEAYLGLLDAVRKDPDVMASYARLVDETAMSKTKDMSLVNMGEDIIENNGIDGIEKFAKNQLEIDGFNAKYYVTAMENGKPVRMSVSKEVFDGFENLNRVPDGAAEKICGFIRKWATNPFKALITGYNPFFALRNIARDIPTSYIQGTENNPFKWVGNLGDAVYRSFKKDPIFEEFLAMGGKSSGYFNAEKGIVADKLPTKAIKRAGEGISWFNEFTETVPRFGEYLGTLKRRSNCYDNIKSLGDGQSKRASRDKALLGADYASKQQGIYNAGEVTVNFGRHGDITKAIDSVVPYLNPAVQGIDKSIRSLSKGSTWAKGFGMLTIPTAAIYLINQKYDKESYDNLDNRTKDNYYLFPTGEGKYIKIPKSRESGVIFATLVERIFRQIEGQEDAFKDFGNTVATNFAPQNPFENNISASLTYYLPRNKDFANRSIVPQSMIMDGRSKHLQYDETTSEIGKWLGKQAKGLGLNNGEGFSPKVIDYIIDSYTGIIGDVLLPATTEGQDPIEKLLIRPFTADVVYNNSIQNDFYEEMDKLQRSKTDDNILGVTDRDWVTPEDKAYSVYSEASKQMSELRDESRRIQSSMPSGKEKDKKLKELRVKVNNIALGTKSKADKVYMEYKKTYIPEISNLSENQQNVYRSTFGNVDKSVGEKQLSGRGTLLTAKQFNDLMKKADTDGKAGVSQVEAKAALNNLDLTNTQKAQLWNAYNKGWKSNPYELNENAKAVKDKYLKNVSDDQLLGLINNMDTDNNGKVNQDEANRYLSGLGVSPQTKGILWNAATGGKPSSNPYIKYLQEYNFESIGKPLSEIENQIIKDDNYITSPYGNSANRSGHIGTDRGTHGKNVPAYSPEDAGEGKVVNEGFNSVFGNFIEVEYPNIGYKLVLKHLDSYNYLKGETVSAGTQLGVVGNTGTDTTGTHLHVEWYRKK